MATKNLSNRASTILSIIPFLVLVVLLGTCVYFFGSDSIIGASQVVLLFCAGLCIWIGTKFFGKTWDDFEKAASENIKGVAGALIILLLVGAVSGTWMMSGVIPTFIYYGVQLISPQFFLPTACIICAFVSLMTGSSWSTIATIGVALLGIGRAEGISDALSAGAIISGAYFGDKISPLSDTTVMASSVAGTPIFEHIKYMMFTTVPSITIALIIFTIIGLSGNATEASEIALYTDTLKASFHMPLWLMIVPIVTAWMIARKTPAIVVLALSSLLAAIFGIIFQPEIIHTIGSEILSGAGKAQTIFVGTIRTIYDSVTYDTGVDVVNELTASRGMIGMLNTIFLILCAMCLGGCMKAAGMIERLARLLFTFTRTRTGLVGATAVTGFSLNGVVSDQFLAIILTSDLYRDIYKKEGYESRLLSRTVEDSATVTSPLFPWSSCGMTQATILGVATIAYAPFCFFNWISPLMSVFMAIIGFKINRKKPETENVA